MHTSLTVKNTVIGSGRTKIAVPLVARDAADLSSVLSRIKNLPFDIVEFRADFLECAGSIGEILHHTQTVRDALPDKNTAPLPCSAIMSFPARRRKKKSYAV